MCTEGVLQTLQGLCGTHVMGFRSLSETSCVWSENLCKSYCLGGAATQNTLLFWQALTAGKQLLGQPLV